ncbi:MAG: hypothetical protein GY925_18620 [Actinomycetia bacterium]|nr:hypothetical protein [Actinomycetes bacterium]
MSEMQVGDRSLASIRTVDRVDPIEGADRIEVARVGGWNIVVKRGEFVPGDRCVYFELIRSCRRATRGSPSWLSVASGRSKMGGRVMF